MPGTTREKSDPEYSERPGKLIAVIEKGRTVDVRVNLIEYQGQLFIDLRTFRVVDALGDRVATRKGVRLPVGKIPELRAALEKAEAVARERGLLECEPETIEAAAA